MAKFLTKRLLSSLITLFIFITILFFVSQLFIPGDFATQFYMGSFNQAEAQEIVNQIRGDLGLDQPLWIQYFIWLKNILHGNFGHSFYGPSVSSLLYQFFAPTVLVFGLGAYVAFQLGEWLGKITAWKTPGWISKPLVFSAVSFYTSFPPWLAFLVVYFLAKWLGLPKLAINFSITGMFTPYNQILADFSMDKNKIMWLIFASIVLAIILCSIVPKFFLHKKKFALMGFVKIIAVLSTTYGIWFLLGIHKEAMEICKLAIFPFITYVLLTFGESMLIMRTSMRDTYGEDYIIAATAKGLSSMEVRENHAAKNAIIPVISNLVISIPYLITGIVIIETSTGWLGIGKTIFNSMQYQDMPVVLGALIIVGIFSLILRIGLDVVQAKLDPRIRLAIENTGELE